MAKFKKPNFKYKVEVDGEVFKFANEKIRDIFLRDIDTYISNDPKKITVYEG